MPPHSGFTMNSEFLEKVMDTIFTYISRFFFLLVGVTGADGFNLTGADSFDLLGDLFLVLFALCKEKINETVSKFDDEYR